MSCDLSWSSVVALLHLDGADASTTFTDETGRTWTPTGNAQIDTAQSKFGGASLLLDGTGDYLSAAHSSDFTFTSGDFTIECWVRTSTTGRYIVQKGAYSGSSNAHWAVSINASGYVFAQLGRTGVTLTRNTVTSTTAVTDGAWHHVAFVRDGSNLKLFVDGTQEGGSVAVSITPLDSATYGASIGNLPNTSASDFNGHIDELRITKGVARYTANFTPDAEAFQGACGSGTPAAPIELTVTGTATPTAPIELTVEASTGTPAAPIELTVEASTGTPAAPIELTVTAVGTPAAPVELTVVGYGTPAAPIELTVRAPSGTPAAPVRLTVTGTGTPAAPVELVVLSATHVPTWRARCVIDGVDFSARLVGVADVRAAEGAARIASITLLPAAGTIEPLDYVGKPITLDYVLVISGTQVPRRLFTGRVDTPFYDPNTTLLRLDCTDDLQNIVAATDIAVLDTLIGGRYTTAVQGEIDDRWDYAQARMSTVAGSLDAAPNGGLRVTPWQIGSTWRTLDESSLLYQRMGLTLPQRSTLVNSVSIAFDYRYARLRQRYTTVGWSGTQIDMAPCGWQYPTQQDILGACNGSGWSATQAVFYPAPASIPHGSGGFIRPPAGSIDMAIVHLTQRHAQTVTEGYALTVTAPESIAANGELPHALRGALASSFDGRAWESALDVAPLMPAGGEQDYAPDAPRADAEYALQTLLDQAEVKILGSHRSARVSNAVLCDPDLDLDKWVVIDTPACQAGGKVAELRHVLDFGAGSAITEFSIAISGVGGAGLITPDTLEPPAAPDEAGETQNWASEVPSLFVNTYGVTEYTDNLMGLLLNPPETITVEDVPDEGTQVLPNPYYVAGTYPVEGFRVRMPGVDDGDRNPLDKPVSATYQIVIPADTLTFTVP